MTATSETNPHSDQQEKPNTLISQDEAVKIALQHVDYPAKLLHVARVKSGGKLLWRITIVRTGLGIPNRDNVLVDSQTGKASLELSAQ